MEQIAFKMFLNPGQADLYKRRHDDIWVELVKILKDAGISDYSIFLDPESNTLFAILRRTEGHQMDQLPKHELMQQWWSFMSDIMETADDGAPVVKPLDFMFHMP